MDRICWFELCREKNHPVSNSWPTEHVDAESDADAAANVAPKPRDLGWQRANSLLYFFFFLYFAIDRRDAYTRGRWSAADYCVASFAALKK